MVPFVPFWSQPYSQPSPLQPVGELHEQDKNGACSSIQKVYPHQEIHIGRDSNRCQHVVNDAVVSNKHVRIYTIIFDNDQSEGIAPLVYAEDLSRNGTYWNGSLIGKGNGGVLLSDGDSLRISPRICYQFQSGAIRSEEPPFDLTQECEMKLFEKEYNVSDRKLGSGACGEVFMAIEQSRRTQLACKIVDLRRLRCPPQVRIGWSETAAAAAAAAEDVDGRLQVTEIKTWAERKQKENRLEQQLMVYHREATILASLRHPNIIGIEKVYITDNSLYIFQDLITGGDLFSFLERKNGNLADVEAAVIVRQILIALEYLHDQNIVHRDLKPENILMTSLANGCRVVLTDFGHAKKTENDRTRMTTMAGTEQYIAPEITGSSRQFNGRIGYTKAIDMWSLGCVTVVLLTGGSPFVNPKTNHYCQKLAQECNLQQLDHVTEWHFVGKRPKDFVRRLLVLDEKQRMTAKEARKHLWFSNESHKVDFEEVYHRATRHWRPRILKTPVIEMINGEQLKDLPMVRQSDLLRHRHNRRPSPVPVDPPYKPYPRRMCLSLLPKRRPSLPGVMSTEVRAAIEENWSPNKMRGKASDADDEDVPALVPDTEADDFDWRQDEHRCQGAQQNVLVCQQHRPSCIPPDRPLVQRQSATISERTLKTNVACEASSAKVLLLPAVRGASHRDRHAENRSARKDADPFGQVEATLAQTKDPNRVENTSPILEATCKGESQGPRGGKVPTNELAYVKQPGEEEAAKESSGPLTDHTANQAKRSTSEGADKMRDFEQKRVYSINSPRENSDSEGTIDASFPAQTNLGPLRGRDTPLKLQSPLKHRLTPQPRRPSNTKRRRGSIYDIDTDEGSEQPHCGLRRSTVDSNTNTFRSNTSWKKARTELA